MLFAEPGLLTQLRFRRCQQTRAFQLGLVGDVWQWSGVAC